MALIVGRAETAVREALKRLRAETTRNADGNLEYRLADRVEPPDVGKRDEFQWSNLLAARDAEIADLKQQLAAAHAKIAEFEAEFLGGPSLERVLQ
jgi:hypothetical protein